MISFNSFLGGFFAKKTNDPVPAGVPYGKGTLLRFKREQAYAAAQAERLANRVTEPVYTRQQHRAEKRRIWKQMRSQRKAMAMKKRDRGGAAAVR